MSGTTLLHENSSTLIRIAGSKVSEADIFTARYGAEGERLKQLQSLRVRASE